jgi:D-lactate dehydrogenase (cytochrome)
MAAFTPIDTLAAIVGADHVLADERARDLASSDLFAWPERRRAELVVRPGSVPELSAVMARLHEARAPVVPRGAGMSYTAGVAPSTPAVALELTRLAAIDIHAEDRYAVAGAGCTWEALAAAPQPHGLRAAQPNPISGAVSTVGGAASQNVPGGMEGIVGLTVVMADGTVARTGSGALHASACGQRNAGPDLTGLFLGDCGAFGVKAEVVSRLAPERPASFASFAYDDADAMLADMAALLCQGLVTRAFSLDRAKAQSATTVSVGEAAGVIGAVVRSASSMGQAVRDIAQLATSQRALSSASWSLHCVTEGSTQALADAQLDLARQVCVGRTKEIDNAPQDLARKAVLDSRFGRPPGRALGPGAWHRAADAGAHMHGGVAGTLRSARTGTDRRRDRAFMDDLLDGRLHHN